MEHKKAFDFLIKKTKSMNFKVLATHIKKVGPLKIKTSNMKFVDHLVKIIVGQQLSVKSAAAIWERTEKILNESNCKKPNDSLNKKFKSAGLSRQKIEYLNGIIFNRELIDMKKIRSSNKVVKVIDNLIENKKIGFIDCSDITDGMSKMKLQKQNIHNEIYAEVEKISYKLLQLI